MGNEFLRHFWASVDSTVKEKAEKNKRIIEQLKLILIKIEKISELKPPDDDNKQGLSIPNGVQKGQRLDKEQRAVAVNGKRTKISLRTSGSSEQVSGFSNGSPRIESEWKDALIQAQQAREILLNLNYCIKISWPFLIHRKTSLIHLCLLIIKERIFSLKYLLINIYILFS